MLVHGTLSHRTEECPGRHAGQLPRLVQSSESGDQPGVRLHAVLWSAACILLAEPDHVAFAIVDAHSAASAQTFVARLAPPSWTCTANAVLNLPSQLPLVVEARASTAVSLPKSTDAA